jgi:hypothetical protein
VRYPDNEKSSTTVWNAILSLFDASGFCHSFLECCSEFLTEFPIVLRAIRHGLFPNTISIGASGGDLNFEGLRGLVFKQAMHSAIGSGA